MYEKKAQKIDVSVHSKIMQKLFTIITVLLSTPSGHVYVYSVKNNAKIKTLSLGHTKYRGCSFFRKTPQSFSIREAYFCYICTQKNFLFPMSENYNLSVYMI